MSYPTLALVTDASALHAQRWAMGFAARGWNVRLLNWGGVPLAYEGIEIIPVLDARPDRGTGPFTALAGYRHLRKLMTVCDVVHVHSLPAGRWVTCLTKLPRLMITPWGSDVLPRQGRLSTAQQRWTTHALKQASAIGAPSKYAALILARDYPLSTQKIHWTPVGVDLAMFDPTQFAARPESPFVVGFFKHLRPIYGPQVLLEALSHFRHQWTDPWEARLYGDGPQRDELQSRIDELVLSDHVRLMGRIPHELLPAAMHACHVVVSPSIVEESLGLASLEAQALGIPVINSNLGGMPETCRDWETGILVPPGEPAALASQLLRLARDPALRMSMGSGARTFVETEGYDWQHCLERADAVQRGLLES